MVGECENENIFSFLSLISIPKSHKQKVKTEGTKSTQLHSVWKSEVKKKKKFTVLSNIIIWNELIYGQLLKIILKNLTLKYNCLTWEIIIITPPTPPPPECVEAYFPPMDQTSLLCKYCPVITTWTESIGLREIIKKLLLRLQRENDEMSG